MDAEIIAVGSEMLTPERLDTNSLYLTGELTIWASRSPPNPSSVTIANASPMRFAAPSRGVES